MSTMISAYGGYVLKYVGDVILAFFVVSPDLHNLSLSRTNAAHCARSMIKVLRQGINPILNQYDYPKISVCIGIDVGENTVIQRVGIYTVEIYKQIVTMARARR